MNEPFYITVSYKGKEIDFPAQLEMFGYTYRFRVTVESQEVFIEKDEEGDYRAILQAGSSFNNAIDPALLKAIISSLKTILA